MNRTQKNQIQTSRNIGKILEIDITGTSIKEVLARVEQNISDSRKFYIVTPNPEIILMAQKNQRLKNALNGTDLAVPDGVGLKIAIPDLNIIKGRVIFSELVALAVKKNWKVFLLGGLGDEAETAARKLQAANKRLQIQFFKGPRLDDNLMPVSEKDIKLQKEAIAKINKFAPDLLFVAFGNPRQEIWVYENYLKLPIGGAMAVGGAFRYIAGQTLLPPKWMTDLGLEWLWRLITEPERIGRIINATVVFPFRVLLSKLG